MAKATKVGSLTPLERGRELRGRCAGNSGPACFIRAPLERNTPGAKPKNAGDSAPAYFAMGTAGAARPSSCPPGLF